MPVPLVGGRPSPAINYLLLAQFLVEVTGTTADRYFTRHVTERAKLWHTAFPPADTTHRLGRLPGGKDRRLRFWPAPDGALARASSGAAAAPSGVVARSP
ncbi:serine hydrolase [Streptomyces sp. NPDC008222]|uniref:serine hydrolase n=1 Tax=Streptomyces sp. NPDC008222 TaxID=3364820 RepID=UPI0036E2078B